MEFLVIYCDGGLFGKESRNIVACSVTPLVTRDVPSPMAVCKSIDTNHASLNDNSVTNYACIQTDHDLFESIQGYLLLPFRSRIKEVSKIVNDFPRYLFKLKHNNKSPGEIFMETLSSGTMKLPFVF